MRKVCLFIAMSLDGYIADPRGSVDWLSRYDGGDSYAEFAKGIDTVLMGRNTYHQIVTELSPQEWIYGDFMTYVFTHRQEKGTENIQFSDDDPVALAEHLKQEPGKDIWICGGANLVRQFVRKNAIDLYYITVVPALLGGGIRLFESVPAEIPLRLLETKSCNGLTDLIYARG